MRITLGARSLIAASCLKCGLLFDGPKFHRHKRSHKDKAAYIDQRCPDCKWGARVKGKANGQQREQTSQAAAG